MDLDDIIQREGEERRRAGQAAGRCAQLAHLALADAYRERIAPGRRGRRAEAGAAPGPQAG